MTTTSTTTQDVVSGAHFKDLAIKLFGRTIPLPESSQISAAHALQNLDGCNTLKNGAEESVSGGAEESSPSENEENQASKEEQADVDGNGTDQERVFKKPDKIIPCPRCNSLETKFCYFNNYNVNQPRHFCKNCQRYWTAGGTMRNVPIGAGRRRNKQLASQYRQIIVSSEGVASSRLETSETTNHHQHQLLSCVESPPGLRPSAGNGTVLKFGPDAPLCESMETVLSLGDQKRCMEIASAYCGDSPEEPSSCGSSMTTTTSIRGNELSGSSSEMAASNTVHCYPVPQLVFPLPAGSAAVPQSSGSSASVAANGSSSHHNPVQWLPATMLAVPGFCTPSLPLQFVPASCWGCAPVWSGGGGGTTAASSSSPTLGKHSRDANSIAEEEKSENCVVVPKTLRVDNPSEASRSPIWATFGGGIRPFPNETALSKATIFETSETNADGNKGHFREAPRGNFYSLL